MTNLRNFSKKTMEELNRSSLEELKNKERNPIWVVLDNVRSMNNVGSVFRTCDAFHIAGIMLCGVTPKPPHRDIQKTALGATESVPWIYHESVEKALEELKKIDFEIWAIEQTHHSISLQDTKDLKNKKLAFIFGNEVKGVSDEALQQCSGSIEIPQWGAKHSLNISVSAGIVLWEFVRELS